MADFDIVLCIPGKWPDRTTALRRLLETNGDEYIFMNNMMMHSEAGTSFRVNIQPADPKLAHAFEVAGQGRLTEAELRQIGEHSLVVYLIGKGGGLPWAELMMLASKAWLNAGGLGVKVDTTGKAFGAEQWVEFVDDEDDAKFFEAMVVLVSDENGSLYSCGMHNMGKPDIECGPELDIDEAEDLIADFAYFLLLDYPVIESGETFSQDEDAPIFRITHHPCTRWEPDDLFFNPFGIYHLEMDEED
jgi:Domain of unknown function (DUF4261)